MQALHRRGDYYPELYIRTGPARNELLTIAVDFNGVIHDHAAGSKGAVSLDSPEVPGAVEWLKGISEKYNVHLISASFGRSGQDGYDARKAAKDWLIGRSIESNWISMVGAAPERIHLSGYKPPCLIVLDDRALTFRGTFPTAEEIDSFKPWNR